MREIALYYPYIHIRDDAWLKAAALYWPRIARLTPPGYPKADSETARALSGELDFILGIDPEPYAHGLRDDFSRFIVQNWAALKEKYAVPDESFPAEPYRSWNEDQSAILEALSKIDFMRSRPVCAAHWPANTA